MNPVLTSCVGTNSDLLPEVFRLYGKDDSRVLDMTYGKGVFWKNVDTSKFVLVRNDINSSKGDVHFDFRNTDFDSNSFDVVILDPPYVFGAGGTDIMNEQYENDLYRKDNNKKGISSIVELYRRGMIEAHRLLKNKGIIMVKCMDLVNGGKQHRIHQDIYEVAIKELNMTDEDLFILVSKTLIMRHPYQFHARKNNSFLWVFRK